MIGKAKECAGLYLLNGPNNPKEQVQAARSVSSPIPPALSNNNSAIMLWHYRLGHPNFQYLKKLFPTLFDNIKPEILQCEVCQLSKHVRGNYPIQGYKTSHPFAIIHSDIWGPSRVNNISGAWWFISFIDDHTRITWIYLMKEKSEAGAIFKNFNSMIQTQFQTKIKVFRTDNAKDYFNSLPGKYLMDQGIVHQSSCVDTTQQNGVTERKNKHLLEVARSIMFTTNVPKHFWGEAVLTATYLINRMPSRVFKFQTPCQAILCSYPDTQIISSLPLKVFGCTAFVHIHQHHRSKLDPKAIKCLFLGYSPTKKGYKCYSPITRKFYTSMDVTFFENQSYYPKTSIQGENSAIQECSFWLDTTLLTLQFFHMKLS
ncbi:hypothetical protein LWI29_036352 [Acer saccharum]|uniref:Integrase catalytic domain-containing protein n=1 Tax=Acer saccharum TaxID=4024 RepID=A0AA39SLF5_ACESA|nr:hypothetical protein LWI29_036352 [Acer saccharum]